MEIPSSSSFSRLFQAMLSSWSDHVAGYEHSICDYDSNTMYAANCQYYILRHVPAFFGSLLPPVMYGIARHVGASKIAAAFAALLIVVDIFNVMEVWRDCRAPCCLSCHHAIALSGAL